MQSLWFIYYSVYASWLAVHYFIYTFSYYGTMVLLLFTSSDQNKFIFSINNLILKKLQYNFSGLQAELDAHSAAQA